MLAIFYACHFLILINNLHENHNNHKNHDNQRPPIIKIFPQIIISSKITIYHILSLINPKTQKISYKEELPRRRCYRPLDTSVIRIIKPKLLVTVQNIGYRKHQYRKFSCPAFINIRQIVNTKTQAVVIDRCSMIEDLISL